MSPFFKTWSFDFFYRQWNLHSSEKCSLTILENLSTLVLPSKIIIIVQRSEPHVGWQWILYVHRKLRVSRFTEFSSTGWLHYSENMEPPFFNKGSSHLIVENVCSLWLQVKSGIVTQSSFPHVEIHWILCAQSILQIESLVKVFTIIWRHHCSINWRHYFLFTKWILYFMKNGETHIILKIVSTLVIQSKSNIVVRRTKSHIDG